MERDFINQKRNSVSLLALLNNEIPVESSDDSDFNIEDHSEESSDIDFTNSEEEDDQSNSVYSEKISDVRGVNIINTKTLLQEAELQIQKCKNIKLSTILICYVCLGDYSDDSNEIVKCDGCGITVHEECYGVPENDSVLSSLSSSSKIPWFCEVCQAGEDNPSCELCPNMDGVFKQTDTGKWVHLVCALYIPGVAFKDVDKLSSVTLFEMSYSKFGARACSLCPDLRFAHTGVCIRCDAGLCRTYFHVTCAQREGLLSEARSEEIEHADPFYAHCKLHSDKDLVRKRKRNWLAIDLQISQSKQQTTTEDSCNFPKNLNLKYILEKYQKRYADTKITQLQPWVPTQKISRPLTSNASVLKALSRKATLNGLDIQSFALKEFHVHALSDVHRKWHISPAFSVEYISYYLDRNNRMESLKQSVAVQLEENSMLVKEQHELQAKYNQALKDNNTELASTGSLKSILKMYHEVMFKVAPGKMLPMLNVTDKLISKNHVPLTISSQLTSAAIEIGMSYPCEVKKSETPASLCLQCGICRLTTDQHLLVKCDTCHINYHLGCLDPPLTRMPKKTKVVGWQCSECDKSSSGSEMEYVDVEIPRQLRNLKINSKEDIIPFIKSADLSKIEKEKENHDNNTKPLEDALYSSTTSKQSQCNQSSRKRQRMSPHRNSLDHSDTPLEGVIYLSAHSKQPLYIQPSKKQKRKNHQRNSLEYARPNHKVQPQNQKQKHDSLDASETKLIQNTVAMETSFKTNSQPVEGVETELKQNTSSVETSFESNSQSIEEDNACSLVKTRISLVRCDLPKKKKEQQTILVCDTCKNSGTSANIVKCDECLKGFHFLCLVPPLKKSPKGRGYSWHCADCDPTESDSDLK